MFWYKVVRFYTIFMMQLHAFISFPAGYDIFNSIRRNFALHEALNIKKQIVGTNIFKSFAAVILPSSTIYRDNLPALHFHH